MKKLLIFFVIFIITCNCVKASENNLEKVSEVIDFSQYEVINRLDCISYILLSCGLAENTDTSSGAYWPLPVQLKRNYKPTDTAWYEWEAYFKGGRLGLKASEYLFTAQQLDVKLIYGEYESDGVIYSDEYRPATVEEVLAFMVRLLNDGEKDDLSDVKVTFSLAEKSGLITPGDAFYSNPSDTITPQEFQILLNRFQSQPRYAYFDVEEDVDYEGRMLSVLKYDTEGSMTYREMLSERGFKNPYPVVSGIDVISVNDAVSYIMKSTGTPKIKVYELHNKSVGYWAEMWGDRYDDYEILIDELYKTSYFCTGTDYVQIAACDTDILSGKYYKYPDKPEFVDVIKYAATADIIPVMVRCLKLPEQTDRTDASKLMEIAVQKGLIAETDTFYSDPEKILTLDEFKIILERFLNQPRYLYTNGDKFMFDDEGSMTYGEYIYSIRGYLK